MSGILTMTDKQKAPAGVTILDADGQPMTELPADVTVDFTVTDPSVAGFEVGPDGMNGFVTSGKVGTTDIVANVHFVGQTVTDVLSVEVKNSAPGAANFTAGAPVDE